MVKIKLTVWMFYICAILSCTAGNIAVIFNPIQVEDKNFDAGLYNDIVAAELSCTEKIKLVDRKALDKLLKERSLRPNGMLEADEVNSIGSLLGADYFVSGSVRVRDKNLLIFVKSISVSSSVMKMKYIKQPVDPQKAAIATVQSIVELLKINGESNKIVAAESIQVICPEKKRPAVAILLPEMHINTRAIIDPAAENELAKVFLHQKFRIKQIVTLTVGQPGLWNQLTGDRTTLLKAAKKAGADYLIYGEAIAENSGSFGNYQTCRARVELKIIAVNENNIVFADSAYAGAADTAEIIAGKKAIQKAASKLGLKAAAALLK